MLGILNDHFERVVGAIAEHGGEVLKFMGDSVLAIFPVDADRGPEPAVEAALGAARDAIARVEAGNVARRAKELPEIRFGIGLHHVTVVYGNIGAQDRLDFTVIGPAVNQAARPGIG
jgi:adenylate cyclase